MLTEGVVLIGTLGRIVVLGASDFSEKNGLKFGFRATMSENLKK